MKYLFIAFSALAVVGAVWAVYPRQIETPAGVIEKNTRSVVYTNGSEDLIRVSSPLSGATVGRNFSVTGDARGTWFFEASFPVLLLGAMGEILVQSPAQAKSEWMTENFVPFQIDITVPKTYTGPATLILKKDNPSGLAEHDASLSFEIYIK